MQGGATDGETPAVARKSSLRGQGRSHKTNAAEGMSVRQGHVDPQLLQGRTPVGKQAFAAGLVDRRLRTVCHQYAQASLPRRDRSRQSCRAAPDHENIRLVWGRVWCALSHVSDLLFFLTTAATAAPSRIPDPSPPARPVCPAPDAGSSSHLPAPPKPTRTKGC